MICTPLGHVDYLLNTQMVLCRCKELEWIGIISFPFKKEGPLCPKGDMRGRTTVPFMSAHTLLRKSDEYNDDT